MIDKNGKLFGKINILDLFLILVLVAILSFAAYYFINHNLSDLNSQTTSITYTVEVKNKNAEYFEHVIPGEIVSDGVTKEEMGVISSFTKKPTSTIVQADDKLILSTNESYFDGYIEITADANVAYPDLLVGGDALKIGQQLALRSESLAIRGYVTAIQYDAEKLGRVK